MNSAVARDSQLRYSSREFLVIFHNILTLTSCVMHFTNHYHVDHLDHGEDVEIVQERIRLVHTDIVGKWKETYGRDILTTTTVDKGTAYSIRMSIRQVVRLS